MSWKVITRPEVADDLVEAAAWYDERQTGLGDEFLQEVTDVKVSLAANPFLNSQRHPRKPMRLRKTKRFPYHIIYEVFELHQLVVVIAVLHSARHDRRWRQRLL